MERARRLGRWAGLVYLITVVTGIFCLMYVPSAIKADGPLATLDAILAHASLYRAGIAVLLIDQAAFVILPLVLYQVFATTHRRTAFAMVALALSGIPVALMAAVYRLDAIELLTNAKLAQAFSHDIVQAMALHALRSYSNSLFVASLFWGLWLLPFGYMAYVTRRIPRVLGALLMLAGACYVISVLGELLMPGFGDLPISNYLMLPPALGEIGTCLWLLAFGVREITHQEGSPAHG